jgi:SAM-dependent methyltransferase
MRMDSNINTSGGSLTRTNPAARDGRFSLRRTFFRHLHESVRHYGVFRTIDELISAVYRLLRDRMPGRRRGRFGDLDFDWEHMVDTTRANVGFRTQLMAALTGYEYYPTEPWLFEQIMQALPIHFSDFLFFDVGSGKGRALLMAAAFPFRKIIGIERLPALHRIAQDNISRYPEELRAGRWIESQCMDALDLQLPIEPTVLYLFNPFPEPIFAVLLEDVRHSLEMHPRPFFVAYRYQQCEHLLIDCDWLKKIAGTEQWVVYAHQGSRKP